MTDGGGAPFTEPAVLVTDAVFVVDTAVDGEPTRGKLVIGQDELALCWEGADRTEWLRIDLDRITDLEPGYVPDQYTDLFEDCVAFSFTDTDGGGIGIVEPAEASVRRLLVALLSQLLDGREALIAHPTERGSQETDEEPEIRPLYAYPYELEFDGESKRGRERRSNSRRSSTSRRSRSTTRGVTSTPSRFAICRRSDHRSRPNSGSSLIALILSSGGSSCESTTAVSAS